MTAERFQRCQECAEVKHPFLFPYTNRKAGIRGTTCLACRSERDMQRMAAMRRARAAPREDR